MAAWQRIRYRGRQWAQWLGGREPAVLVSILIIVAATWSFIELADEVFEGDTQSFDKWAVRAMRTDEDLAIPRGKPWVQELGRDATALGGYGCLIFFTLATAAYLWLDQKRHLSQFLLASAISGYMVSTLLKYIFQRPRPDVVPHLSNIYNSTSFPSGHSMNAAVIYLTLGTIVATAVARKRLKVYVISVAATITFFVGLSRVYLGVHYPTDVLAGWMAGLVWALICWLLARYLQRRGQVEKPVAPPDEPEAAEDPGVVSREEEKEPAASAAGRS